MRRIARATHAAIRATVPCMLLFAACDNKPASSAGATNGSASSVASPSNIRSLPHPADAEDDALAPGCLPRSGAAGDWTKVAPIKTFPASELSKLMPPEVAARCKTFGIKSAARCTYARPAGGRHCQADVLLIEATRVEDAFGLMSIHSSAPEEEIGGCIIRTSMKDGLHSHAWQGLNYLHVWSVDTDEAAAAAVRKLVQNIASRIQREEPPALLEALPKQGAVPGKRWLVRNLTALPPEALGLTPSPDWERVSEAMSLAPDTIIAICQYEVPRARRPDTVWVAAYSSVDAARDAHARYSQFLERDKSPATLSTSVMDPQDRFLTGTWTAEEESMLYVMPRVLQLLPS